MFDPSEAKRGIALALSGGGYRATLFHLGSLWRLNELGYLPKLKVITSVSGGSITSGVLARRWRDLCFDKDGVAANFREQVADPLQRFCARGIDIVAGLAGLLPGVNGSDVVSWHYARHLFGRTTLQDLPSKKAPRFVFYAASLQTGAGVRMSRDYVADYRVGWQLPRPEIRLADAVAASSAFPPVFSPMIIPTDPDKWEKWNNPKRQSTLDDPRFRSRLILTDGGVYDNLGLETIWKKYDTVLVSDASAPLKADPTPSSLWAWLAARVLGILSYQTRALRVRRLVADYQNKVRKGTYWGITTNIAKYELDDAMTKCTELTRSLAEVRTRLNRFDAIEQGHLINWGYALADAAMRRHVLHGGSPGRWPDPDHPLD